MNLLGAIGGQDPRPVELTFKGLQTMQTATPDKTRVMYVDIVQNSHYEMLEKIADEIIKKFLEKGVTTEKELSHVTFNQRKQMWQVKFHLTVLRSLRSRAMDANELLNEFHAVNLGTC